MFFSFIKALFGDGRPNVPILNGVPFDPRSPTFTSRDSRPYQAAVQQAAQDAGLNSCQRLSLDDAAAHIHPDVITEMYGAEVGRRCAELQAYNGKR